MAGKIRPLIYVIKMIKDDSGVTMICCNTNKFYQEQNHKNHSSDKVLIGEIQ